MSDNRFTCGCGQWLWVYDKSNIDFEYEESDAIILNHPDPGEMNVRIEKNGQDSMPKVFCGDCEERMFQAD